jgi:tetratricopeptide (TPR) repeat protein
MLRAQNAAASVFIGDSIGTQEDSIATDFGGGRPVAIRAFRVQRDAASTNESPLRTPNLLIKVVVFPRGTVYCELEQYDDAASAFQNTVRIEPDNAYHHCSLAAWYLDQNKPSEAKRSAEEALRSDANLADGYLLLGCALHCDPATF